MSYYQDGYDKGYQDALDGKKNYYDSSNDASFGLFDAIGGILDTDADENFRDGYNDGYDAGIEELE